MGERRLGDGPIRLTTAAGATLLPSSEGLFEAFEAMLEHWRIQQLSAGLKEPTVLSKIAGVKRFAVFTATYPWEWTPVDLEDFSAELLSARCRMSTVRHYQVRLRLFMEFLLNPAYPYVRLCEQHFGTHPVQICHDWNTLHHRDDYEGDPNRRGFSAEELQLFLDHADASVETALANRRKGWLTAHRDAALFKVQFAWGLRSTELCMLELEDWATNPKAPQFGRYGALSVRFGKAKRGGAPRRRTVLTVFPWAAAVAQQYVEEIRPLYGSSSRWLWPTERGTRVSARYVDRRFDEYRRAVGLPAVVLVPHSFRHSYATTLIESGFDPLFAQRQLGHTWASSTARYAGVSSDYMNNALAAALAPLYGEHRPALDADSVGRNV